MTVIAIRTYGVSLDKFLGALENSQMFQLKIKFKKYRYILGSRRNANLV